MVGGGEEEANVEPANIKNSWRKLPAPRGTFGRINTPALRLRRYLEETPLPPFLSPGQTERKYAKLIVIHRKIENKLILMGMDVVWGRRDETEEASHCGRASFDRWPL